MHCRSCKPRKKAKAADHDEASVGSEDGQEPSVSARGRVRKRVKQLTPVDLQGAGYAGSSTSSKSHAKAKPIFDDDDEDDDDDESQNYDSTKGPAVDLARLRQQFLQGQHAQGGGGDSEGDSGGSDEDDEDPYSTTYT